MTGWLLDTNVVSELRRLRPQTRVVAFVAAQPPDRLFCCCTATAAPRESTFERAGAGSPA